MFMYKISMIIPIFNVEDCLGSTMDSLINQTIGFENLEVILVDDCSTDSTPKLIKEYVKKYDNCKNIFLNENSGSAGIPRNIGIKESTAPYLMFMDPDDIYTPNACEIFYNKIQNTDIDFIHANWINITYGYSAPTVHPYMKQDELFEFDGKENIINYHKYYRPGMCAAIYNRKFVIDNNIICTNELGEDLYFALLAMFKAKKVLFLADFCDSYLNITRDTKEYKSITNIRDTKRFNARLRSLYLLLNLLEDYPINGNYYALNKEIEILISQFYVLYPSISMNERKKLIQSIYLFEKDLNFINLNKFHTILNYFIINHHFIIACLISKISGFIYNNYIFRIIFRVLLNKFS